jgi:hypothetical protein
MIGDYQMGGGKNKEPVPAGAGFTDGASPSPDGKVEQLTRPRAGVSNCLPQAPPHSEWVVFGSPRAGPRQLHVGGADGTGVYPITRQGPDGVLFTLTGGPSHDSGGARPLQRGPQRGA